MNQHYHKNITSLKQDLSRVADRLSAELNGIDSLPHQDWLDIGCLNDKIFKSITRIKRCESDLCYPGNHICASHQCLLIKVHLNIEQGAFKIDDETTYEALYFRNVACCCGSVNNYVLVKNKRYNSGFFTNNEWNSMGLLQSEIPHGGNIKVVDYKEPTIRELNLFYSSLIATMKRESRWELYHPLQCTYTSLL